MLCECLGMNSIPFVFGGRFGDVFGLCFRFFFGAFLDYFRGFGINYGIFAVGLF